MIIESLEESAHCWLLKCYIGFFHKEIKFDQHLANKNIFSSFINLHNLALYLFRFIWKFHFCWSWWCGSIAAIMNNFLQYDHSISIGDSTKFINHMRTISSIETTFHVSAHCIYVYIIRKLKMSMKIYILLIQNWHNVEGIFYLVGEYRVVATKSIRQSNKQGNRGADGLYW